MSDGILEELNESIRHMCEKLEEIQTSLGEISSKLGDAPNWWTDSFDLGQKLDVLEQISDKLDKLDDIKDTLSNIESKTGD